MRIAVTLQDASDCATDFLIDADADTPVIDVLRHMGLDTADVAAGEAIVSVSGAAIDPLVSLRAADIRQGTLVVVRESAAPQGGTDAGLVDIGVSSGPHTGRFVRLGPGRHSIGSAPSSDAVFPPLPAQALIARVDMRMGVEVRAVSALVYADLAGTPLTQEFTAWPAEVDLRIGDVLLQQRGVTEIGALLEPVEDGSAVNVNRPPRLRPVGLDEGFRIPAAPAYHAKNSLPWLAALLPLAGGVVSAFIFQSFAFLALALLSPIMVMVNAWSAKRQGRRSHSSQVADHEATIERIEADIEEHHALERTALLASAPSAADLWTIATAPGSRLWERRPADDDHLLLRVGTSNLPSSVVVEDLREPLEHRRRLPPVLRDVPTTVPLAASGVIGVAGAPDEARAVAKWFLAQLAILQSPRDVQLVVLTSGDSDADWGWSAWLPHCAPALGQDARAVIGNDADTIGRRVSELAQLVAARQAQNVSSGARSLRFPTDVVVVWDGARRLRSYPGVAGVLRDGPAVGVYAICVDDSERSLPEECNSVVTIRPDGHTVVRRSSHEAVQNIRLDEVFPAWFEQVARAIAPIRDNGDGEEDAIPATARLTEVMELEPLRARGVAAGWAGGARSTRAVIGVSLDGPFSIDLVADGPHGLVAGTTGSGKSELLQTLVASLALTNRPDAMNFVLIDYKGGAAFKDAVRLPHTVGMVTDLDAHLVERALTSLGAELTRRERLLAAAGAKDIEDYVAAHGRGFAHAHAPLPRLLIIIDEFASMARELPDFVTGLVNIAQRGRSLGIHLILATQRPSGVVSADIRANTNLRISLRVTDVADSSDVIDAPDAARIAATSPGRAYVRLGHSSLVPFQTARVGGRSRAMGDATPVIAPFVAELGWPSAGHALPVRPHAAAEGGQATDLSRIVDAARDAAVDLGLPPNHSPWLPALPEVVLRGDLPAGGTTAPATGGGSVRLPAAAWALSDIPSVQSQPPVMIDLAELSHLFIVGAARSGRSQALRTIAGALADTISTADLHLFGIDMGNGALLPLNRLPHTGAVVQRSERERVVRLFDRLQAELTRRQELLGQLGVANISEQREQADADRRLPHFVVLLDRWESFVSTFGDVDGGALVEQVLGFLREGASAGIHLVLAGDRSLLSGRISVLTEEKWVLRLADRGDYGMAGLNPRKLALHVPDGRMFRASTGQEAQVALLDKDPSAMAQAAALTDIAMRARERDLAIPSGLRPLRIDLLPATLTWEEARQYPSDASAPALWALLGVGGDELTSVGVDLADGPSTFLIAGPPRSGRSNLLASMARSFLEAGTAVVLICPRPSPLRTAFAGHAGVRAVFERADVGEQELRDALDVDGPVVVIIDDGELVREMPGKDFLRDWVRAAAGKGHGIVLGGSTAEVGTGFNGWQTDIRNNQRGALLSPRNQFDGDLIGVRIPRSATTAPIIPGRAIVHRGGSTLQTLQVPKLDFVSVSTQENHS